MSIFNIVGYINFKFKSGEERTVTLKKNVCFSLVIKLFSIVISLLLVPLTIDFVNPVQYGVWLTISSIVTFISFFDIGFSNGLRNRLAEALAGLDVNLARNYISTTYAVLTLIFSSILIVALCAIPYVNLTSILNIDVSFEQEVKVTMAILLIYFCATFVLKILSFILIADQLPAYSSAIELAGQFISLLLILVFKETVQGSLIVLGLGLCLPPLLAWIIASFLLFITKYKKYRPSFKFVRKYYAKDLLNLGVKFFIIQIASLVQFQTANILIARYYSMQDVTVYNISYKYFGVLFMVFMIVLQPFWSAVTDAYTKRDHSWIVTSVRKYCYIVLMLIICGILMLIAANFVYNLWIGELVSIPFILSFWTFMYYSSMMIGSIFVYFVNGIGALKIQFMSSLISPFVFLLLFYVLCNHFHLGVSSILIASIVANFNGLILAPIQYFNVIIKKRKGIWIA